MPNIAIYRDQLLAPSETFVLQQAEALRGFTPYYVGSRRIPGLPLPEDRTLVIHRGSSIGRLREVPFKLWGRLPGLARHLRRLQPALVHAHFGPDGATALPIARALGIPLIVTFHGYDATTRDEHAAKSFYRHRRYLQVRRELQAEGRLFLAVSRFVQQKLWEQGYPEEKVVVHYIGVDTELFQPDPGVERENLVLFVGRLVQQKGCEYLIRALSRVQRAVPGVRLVVIGDGPMRRSLEAMAQSLLADVRFLGTQPPVVVREWMKRARVFSVPSITLPTGVSEGFGIVFAEAQAMGLPVTSFATGGIPEAVEHGRSGFLAPERDWEALAARIELLLTHAGTWQEFSTAGRKRVCRDFDLRRQTAKLEQLYGAIYGQAGACR